MLKKIQPAAAPPPGPDTVTIGAFDSGKRRQMSGPGLRAFLNIADTWALTEPERLNTLGMPARSTYYQWVAKAHGGGTLTLPLDVLLRISAVLGIYKALQIIFIRPDEGRTWLRNANTGLVFGGQAPLALITAGTQDGIMQVRRHLDAWRGGTFSAATVPGKPETDSLVPPLTEDDIVFL